MSTTNTITAPSQPARPLDHGGVLRLVFGSLGLLAALALIGAGGRADLGRSRRSGTAAATSPRTRITTRRPRTRSGARAPT
jgi:hypothetical protein